MKLVALHYGKESPDSISKAPTHACGVGIDFYFIRPLFSFHLMDTES